jgi:glucokinase
LAYDVGGSHVAAGLCRLDTLDLENVATAPLTENPSSEAFLDILQELARKATARLDRIAGASLAFPGPFDYAAGVSQMRHKLQALFGIDLKLGLGRRLGLPPERIRFLNDAGAALLGEIGGGAAKGASRVVGFTLGTGIGSAFAADNELITQGEEVPPGGEIWNLPFRGTTVEDLLSTRGLQRAYEERTGKHLTVALIAAEAPANEDARKVFEAFGCHLGEVINEILAPFAPQLVVIGGGISRSSQLFLPAAQRQVNIPGLRIVTSTLLDKAALVGATVFWRNERS